MAALRRSGLTGLLIHEGEAAEAAREFCRSIERGEVPSNAEILGAWCLAMVEETEAAYAADQSMTNTAHRKRIARAPRRVFTGRTPTASAGTDHPTNPRHHHGRNRP
jgi:hypothetical protein